MRLSHLNKMDWTHKMRCINELGASLGRPTTPQTSKEYKAFPPDSLTLQDTIIKLFINSQ